MWDDISIHCMQVFITPMMMQCIYGSISLELPLVPSEYNQNNIASYSSSNSRT